MAPWAVYVHVPFCVRRCLYCDFATDALAFNPTVRRDRFDVYLEAIGAEIAQSPRRPAATLFFGGGTPTTLHAAELLGLYQAVVGRGGLLPAAEVTTEANPTTAEAGLFGDLRRGGFNRLSLGVQSFNDHLLERLGRTHSADEARLAFDTARRAGFDNVSIDLMFALPGQDLADWQRTLRQAVALQPEHISLYGLTVEPGTPLETLVAGGRMTLLDEALQADMYELAMDHLGEHGFEHYEISNFAKPGQRSAHNQVYWRNEEYRGFGPGAASYVGGQRWTNVAAADEYARRVAAGDDLAAESEHRALAEERRETMYLGLRLLDGVRDAEFAARYGEPPGHWFGAELARLTQRGLLVHESSAWRLTRLGTLLANQVFIEFV
ncbi:MAG: radical SAM family heme chaperone HemW [Armatimonadetes bacterium]|nr:radical SAM family heme chaperone HemW [Armatimonadota bacterium]